MRGFGVTSASFAIELQMTRNAAVLGIDPWELRLKNANRIGDPMPTRKVLAGSLHDPVIQAAPSPSAIALPATFREMTNDERSGELAARASASPSRTSSSATEGAR